MSFSNSRVLAGSLVVSLSLAAILTFRQPVHPAQANLVNVETILEETDRDATKAVAVNLRRIDSFFEDAKTRTPIFATDVLSLTTKAKYVFQSKIVFSAHLEALFASDVCSQAQLEQAVLQTVDAYQADIVALENRMLVQLASDTADLPKLALPSLPVNPISRAAFDEAIRNTALKDLGADVARLIAFNVSSSVVEAALSRSLSRLTFSGAILGLGGASSWQTAGISLVVAVVIDYGLSKGWEFVADPKGKLVTELNQQIDTAHQAISTALRKILDDACLQRQALRHQAVHNLLGR